MFTEQFKPIKGYEGLYEVSNFGIVKSLSRKIVDGARFYISKEKTLKQGKDGGGYMNVRLSKNAKLTTFKIHHLVWDAFGDKLRNGSFLQVDHKDENKLNNHIDNLQLLTTRQNTTKNKLFYKSNTLPTGVSWDKINNKYRSSIIIGKKSVNLGRYNNVADACRAYQNRLGELSA